MRLVKYLIFMDGNKEVIAYVLIVTEIGKEHEVVKKLSEIEGVKEVRSVYGEYDIVARLQGSSLNEVDTMITKIRKTPGILRTVTLISA